MWRKGLMGTLVLLLLTACDSTESPDEPILQAPALEVVASSQLQTSVDPVLLAERYQGQTLTVLDASELEEDGASVLSLTFSVPLLAGQDFAQRVHVVDSKSGKLDGAWELSDDQLELRLRHIPPKRTLIVSVDAGLYGFNQAQLKQDYSTKISTRDLPPSVGFASRGSLLPAEFSQGLPVVALNVEQVDVEFFRLKPLLCRSF